MADTRKRPSASSSENNPIYNVHGEGIPGSSTLFIKLYAAVFYGLSSFLIVVVNKSVLTNYR